MNGAFPFLYVDSHGFILPDPTSRSRSKSPSPSSNPFLDAGYEEHDSDSKVVINDLTSPSSPTFVSPSLDAEAYLRSISPPPSPFGSTFNAKGATREPLSPDVLPPGGGGPSHPSPITAIKVVGEDPTSPTSTQEGVEGDEFGFVLPRPRIVRFKSRVRISCMSYALLLLLVPG